MSSRPSIPKGTRDFGPVQVHKRKYILESIRKVFESFGFVPIETPAMENLSTLTGKYGDEGDKLLFKILNSGDYLQKANEEYLQKRDSNSLIPFISGKGLRYDLTVPFARFVVMHQHELNFPFKRYQMQPVWRADRPQKGRYREFWQCDADVVGSDSLLSDVEFIQIYDQVFSDLNIDSTIRINNRKILEAITEHIGALEKFTDICVAIDKMDKIGLDGVEQELKNRGLTDEQIGNLKTVLAFSAPNLEKLDFIKSLFKESGSSQAGTEEMHVLLEYLDHIQLKKSRVEFDLTLARGLSYYTGTIYEVAADKVSLGSIASGGRYDDLTGVFGLSDLSGIGISFGLERIYDVLEESKWPSDLKTNDTGVLIINFDKEGELHAIEAATKLREEAISTEIYLEAGHKMKKKMRYADQSRVPYVILIGANEIASGKLSLKSMQTGEQEQLTLGEIIEKIRSAIVD